MMDIIVGLIALVQSTLTHFIASPVVLTNDVSGEWFAYYQPELSDKGHAVTGALSSIIDYGTVFLAQLLAVITYGASGAANTTIYTGAGTYMAPYS
ncbi:MAG: hypothetical protein MUP73_04920, partial [Dehalococcoidia bacterium]|nr:hypothetical protein [Dehalococcoidia bacterium]